MSPATQEPAGKELGWGGGKACTGLLKTLTREEILEVLSGGFCRPCQAQLESRVLNLTAEKTRKLSLANDAEKSSAEHDSSNIPNFCSTVDETVTSTPNRQHSAWKSTSQSHDSTISKGDKKISSTTRSVDRKQNSFDSQGFEMLLNDGLSKFSSVTDDGLSEEQKEHIRVSQVGRKKDFIHTEKINGKPTNILQGLELHTNVFNSQEQMNIVECVYDLQRRGEKGQLRERTYTAPRKWMRGKGRVTLQFGCCYNYAVDKSGNPPGIIRGEEVDPLPLLFKQMIKRMVKWRILPPTRVPNSCIVNIYDEGDCIPPHIDHHDFLRPFCTVSFLSECSILFGSSLKVVNAGEFSGPVSISLPVGSVFILNGNGADIAKHCVPAVPARRISITFRKMDDSKLPYEYSPDPELVGIKPIVDFPSTKSTIQQSLNQKSSVFSPQAKFPQQDQLETGKLSSYESKTLKKSSNFFIAEKDDFPPLGRSPNVQNGLRGNKSRMRQ